MSFTVSSRSGRLLVNGIRISAPHTESLFPSTQFASGDLSIPATEQNILTVSQCFLDLYTNPMGIVLEQRSKGKKWLHSTHDIENQYGHWDGSVDKDDRSKKGYGKSINPTRGWHLFAVNTLHHFFWKDFDCYRGSHKLEESNDYHWWLENNRGDTIDLAEDQYRVSRIPILREGGKKLKPLGTRYCRTYKNMAHGITEVISGHKYDANRIDCYANAYMKR